MWRTIVLAVAIPCWGCSPAPQSDGIRPVAAVEIRLLTTADRDDLITKLRQLAPPEGLHVDDTSAKWHDLEQKAKDLPPSAKKTIYVGVWRGADDTDLVTEVDDGGHIGRAWIIFFPGQQPKIAELFRVALSQEIRSRWPDARTIPILPSGALPLSEDLRLTPGGYKIVRSAADKYELPPSSTLLADD